MVKLLLDRGANIHAYDKASICLTVCQYVCLSLIASTYLYIYMYIYQSIYLYIYLFICQSICDCVYYGHSAFRCIALLCSLLRTG